MGELDRWHCWKHEVVIGANGVNHISGGYMGNVNYLSDCIPATLSDFMIQAGWIDSLDGFSIDDSYGIKVFHDTKRLEFIWSYGRRLYLFNGIPGHVSTGDTDARILVDGEDILVGFNPIYSHDDYADNIQVRYSNLQCTSSAGDGLADFYFSAWLDNHTKSIAR